MKLGTEQNGMDQLEWVLVLNFLRAQFLMFVTTLDVIH